MASKKRQMNRARKQSANPLVLLNSFELEAKQVAAEQCAMVCYTQKDAAGSRRHFVSRPNEAPRKEGTPIAKNAADPNWWQLPEKQLKKLGGDALAMVRRGVTIDEHYRVVEREAI